MCILLQLTQAFEMSVNPFGYFDRHVLVVGSTMLESSWLSAAF